MLTQRTMWLLAGMLTLAACEDAKPTEDQPAADKPATSATTKGKTQPAVATPDKPAEKPAADESGIPAEVKALALPAGAEKKNDPQLGSDLFSFEIPKGYAFTQKKSAMAMAGAPKSWVAVEGDGVSFAFMSHNPSGDDGPGCPKVDEMKAKVSGAKILLDKSFKTEMKDDVSVGDEVNIFIFEKDGKTGFYATKMFDHGDDATTYCAATGTADDAKALTATYDKAKTEALAAIFMSLKFSI